MIISRIAASFVCATLAFSIAVPSAIAQAGAAAKPSAVTQPIFYFLDSTGNQLALEYKLAESRLLSGISVQGDRSTVRFPANAKLKFLARLPVGMGGADVRLFRYDVRGSSRNLSTKIVDKKTVLVGTAALIQLNLENMDGNSFAVTPKTPLVAGEYCLGTATKGNNDVYCFGLDGSDSVSEAPQQQMPGAHPMTNADVVKLVSVGLSPEVVSSSIRQAAGHDFDLSIDALIALKTNKIPDPVIATMQQFAGTGAASTQLIPASVSQPTSPAASGKIPPDPPDLSVFYYVTAAGKLGRLEASKAEIIDDHKTMFDGVQAKLQIFGAKSAVRLSDGAVAIVVKLPQKPKGFAGLIDETVVDLNGMLFRRWESTPGARQMGFTASKLRRGEKRDPDLGEFEFTVSKIGDSFFRITPVEPLMPGEYCVALTTVAKNYCFGIDPPR